ncbi:MAG: UDP-N-acetylmuramoyl-L-alanine--D-glutamate ligase, partial [Candidatus Eisenbacteria sp.]|nr:UDP-N-acetylmuramoyl-L-alanine--D-glutamate ligase [Candidatus Eisenbacteria bacterium]
GIPVRSELILAAGEIRTPILAITGTNGKSTTTAWTAHLLRRAGVGAVAAGNIGRPLSGAILEEPAETIFVVEVSSFQLEDSPEFHPRAAAILNITPDHLDRHGSFAAYTAAKWAIASHQEPGDILVLGPGLQVPPDARIRSRIVRCDPDMFDRQDRKAEVQRTDSRGRETGDGGPCHGALPGGDALYLRKGIIVRRSGKSEYGLLPATGLSLPGPHNLINAMTAVALASALVTETERLVRGLRDFPGLPHRLEEVGRIGQVRMINDSKSTNVDSLRVALSSFTEPVVLLAGGRDKEGPFEDLADLAARSVRHLVAIGETAEKIRRSWPHVSSETATDLNEAISLALAASPTRGVVLLSPGCASFDMFRDYEERGDVFRALVAERSGNASRSVQGR